MVDVAVPAGSPARTQQRERIVDAAARLLREEGVAAVTTRAVAEAAGVQAPAIYRQFGDKDGLLDAVAEHALAAFAAEKAAQVDEGDPVDDLRAAWTRYLAFGLGHPALYALMADPARGSRSPAVATGLEVLRARVRRVAAAGRLAVPEDRAVAMIHAAGTGAVLTLLATPEADRDPALGDALLDAVLGRVLSDAPARTDATTTSTAVALRATTDDLTMLTPGERALLGELLERVAYARPCAEPDVGSASGASAAARKRS